jgi:hypothetical protein
MANARPNNGMNPPNRYALSYSSSTAMPMPMPPSVAASSDASRDAIFLPSRVFSQQGGQPGTRWESQSVMDWITSVAKAAEQRQGGRPIQIGSIRLSERMESFVVDDDVTRQRQTFHNQHAPVPHYSTPRYWDLSYLARSDPYVDSAHGCYSLSHLRYLAVQYENFLYYYSAQDKKYWMDYQTVQHRLYFLIGRIFGQYPRGTTAAGELRVALDALYRDTIKQMQKILAAASAVMYGTTTQPDEVASYQPMPTPTASTAPVPMVAATATIPKKDISRYLTQWLRENWTNPYPDDEGVTKIAATCGTSNMVVNNWLINARTRKWRPALVKAVALGRPADFLLEDSINIFDGNPVRPLDRNNNTMYYKPNTTSNKKRSRG